SSGAVPARAGTTPRLDCRSGQGDRLPGVRPVRTARAERAPAASHGRQRTASPRCWATRDRAAVAPPKPRVHRHLRQGRCCRAAAPRPCVAGCGMTDLQAAAAQYLAFRRAVGFKLTHVEPLLADFVRFAGSRNAAQVTCDLALQWATAPQDATPAWWKGRLCVVRCFARYLSAVDPATEVPPTDLLPRLASGSNRAEPYL